MLLYRDTIIFLPSPCCLSYHSVCKLLPWSKGPHFLSQCNQVDITHSATSTENARLTEEKSSFQLNNLHSWCWVAKITEPFLTRLSEHVVDLHPFLRHVKAFFLHSEPTDMQLLASVPKPLTLRWHNMFGPDGPTSQIYQYLRLYHLQITSKPQLGAQNLVKDIESNTGESSKLHTTLALGTS